ncbi:MAG: hypothetical protein AB1938_09060 [Myxococcota bacterium]
MRAGLFFPGETMRSWLVLAVCAGAMGCVMPRSMTLGQMAAPVGRGAMEVGVFTGVQYGGQSDPPFTTTTVGGETQTNQKSSNTFALPGAEANLQYGFTDQVALNVHASAAGLQPGVKWTLNKSKVAHVALLPAVAFGYGSTRSAIYVAGANGVQSETAPASTNAFSFLGGLKFLVSHRSGFFAGVGYDFQLLRSRSTFVQGSGNVSDNAEAVTVSIGHQVAASVGMDIAFGMVHLRPEIAFAIQPGIATTQTTRVMGNPDNVLSGGGGLGWAIFPGFTIAVASPRREKTAAEEEEEEAAAKKKRRGDDDEDDDETEEEPPAKKRRGGGDDEEEDDSGSRKRRSSEDDE